MKILFVLSQIEVTGAETYALTLASALRELGHEIVLVSEKLQNTDHFKFYSLPLHSKNSSYAGRIKNVFALRKIIKDEKIELVHSHSRAANLITYFALWGSGKIPMVVTVHGRWRNHFAARRLPCLGDRTIAVCPYLERYLAGDLKIPPGQIHMIPNGIDTSRFTPSSKLNNTGGGARLIGGQALSSIRKGPELLFVGRFSGQKGNVIHFLLKAIFPELVRRVNDVSINILSLSPSKEDIESVKKLNDSFHGEVVKIYERQSDTLDFYREAGAVIGSGRVALEAMSVGKPVVSIGESSAPGLVTAQNFQDAFDSNFGDCGEWNLFEKQNNLIQDLEKILKNKTLADSLSTWGRKTILERFDSKKIALQVENIYKSVLQ